MLRQPDNAFRSIWKISRDTRHHIYSVLVSVGTVKVSSVNQTTTLSKLYGPSRIHLTISHDIWHHDICSGCTRLPLLYLLQTDTLHGTLHCSCSLLSVPLSTTTNCKRQQLANCPFHKPKAAAHVWFTGTAYRHMVYAANPTWKLKFWIGIKSYPGPKVVIHHCGIVSVILLLASCDSDCSSGLCNKHI